MKKLLSLLMVLLSIFSTIITAYAHAGSTDEYGGHIDWSTGEYHYHHGYPAHSHDGGYCPYDFIDNADHSNKGGSGNTSNNYNYGDREPYLPEEQYRLVSPTPKNNYSNGNKNLNKNSDDTDYSWLIFIPVALFLFAHHQWKKEKRRQKFEEEKQHYRKLYGGKDILDIINAPSGAFVDSDGNPHQTVGNDDIFVIYVAPKQPRVFHRNRKCSKNLVKKNYIDIDYYHNGRKKLNPCKKCKPAIPDTKWYDEYRKIKATKDKYGIK